MVSKRRPMVIRGWQVGRRMSNARHGPETQLSDPETWLERYGDYLFRYAMLRVHERQVAEDLVQEALVAALDGRDRYRGTAPERTWLVGILKHKVIDHIRKTSREKQTADLDSSSDPALDLFDEKEKWRAKPGNWPDDPRTILEQKEFWEILWRCLAGLPTHLSQAFVLRELEELGAEEVCNLMAISLTNLGVRLYRARMRLRRCLEENELGRQTP